MIWGKKWLPATVAVLLVVAILGSGCTSSQGGSSRQEVTVKEQLINPDGQIEEREVTVPCPPGRVVVLGAYPAEIVKALGVEKAVIAVDESTKKNGWPEYVLGVEDAGSSFTPSVEKIIALKPDLVIEAFLKSPQRDQLLNAGIPVLKIYGYKTEILTREIRTLGLVFNCQERANAFAAYIEKQWRTVRERTEELGSGQKPKVYWEYSYGDWKTGGPGSGLQPLIEWAGGINIAAELGVANPVVNPEWVAAKNPDVIIKYVGRELSGWTVKDTEKLEELRRQLMSRPGLKNTNAVKHGRVYLISDLITCAPRGAAGEYYVAKWLHPELFKDIDPEAVHREMLKKFYGEELKGVWVYPSK
ncbi:MAG: iron complex transport system substrate-binding protein [Thermoanaerobacter sp.]|jgi:iron complex transport system substrate-binding protein|uniref:ABC transporter substrate-binding protein n=1 Tax=Desulfofundulus thermocisternus TaxID=42471 RepID=UPI000A041314|nr:ABC transporter substrate-binding protein [Desulfofundulus thermocisternus]MDK2888920.1 iron complex transport system substrate-binding protein [Thermoanaerobacter sp.]